MKTKKWKKTLTAVLSLLLLLGSLPAGAAEIGTEELAVNGGFTLTDGVPEGWGIVYGSSVTWDQIAVLDSEETGDGHIDLSFLHSKAYGVGLTVQTNPGDNWLLTFDYKAQGDVSFQIQGNYTSSLNAEASFTAFKKTMSATTVDGFTRASVLIPAATANVEDVEYKADSLGLYFRNVAKKTPPVDEEGNPLLNPPEGTTLLLDNISIRTYTDEGLFKNGDFTLSETSWDKTGSVEFVDGKAKIVGTASNSYIHQECSTAPASILPDGFSYTYYKVSLKCKFEASEVYEGSIPVDPGIKIYGTNSSGGEVNFTGGNWRGTTALTDGWYQYTYYGSKIATNIVSLSLLIRGVGEDLTMYVDDIVVEPWNFRIHNGSNVNVNTLTPGNKITIEAVVANSGSASIAAKPFYAFYAEKDGNKQLISLAIPNEAVTVEAGKGSGISSMRSGSIVIPTPPEGHTVTMKAMILEEGKLKPLCQYRIMGQEQ